MPSHSILRFLLSVLLISWLIKNRLSYIFPISFQNCIENAKHIAKDIFPSPTNIHFVNMNSKSKYKNTKTAGDNNNKIQRGGKRCVLTNDLFYADYSTKSKHDIKK